MGKADCYLYCNDFTGVRKPPSLAPGPSTFSLPWHFWEDTPSQECRESGLVFSEERPILQGLPGAQVRALGEALALIRLERCLLGKFLDDNGVEPSGLSGHPYTECTYITHAVTHTHAATYRHTVVHTHAVTHMENKSFLKIKKSLKTCCAHPQLQNASHLESVEFTIHAPHWASWPMTGIPAL